MKVKGGSGERSAVTGQVMKKKVKKTSKDKEVKLNSDIHSNLCH